MISERKGEGRGVATSDHRMDGWDDGTRKETRTAEEGRLNEFEQRRKSLKCYDEYIRRRLVEIYDQVCADLHGFSGIRQKSVQSIQVVKS